MNPSSNETSGAQLPAPMMEQAPSANGAQAGQEQLPGPLPELPVMSPAQPTIPLPQIALPVVPPSAGVPQNDVSATTTSASATTVTDSDLIEKEWVTRAKAIVERTKEDPHAQSEELTVVKAEYLKKRYNKTLKTNK
jgi:hypothetical protein